MVIMLLDKYHATIKVIMKVMNNRQINSLLLKRLFNLIEFRLHYNMITVFMFIARFFETCVLLTLIHPIMIELFDYVIIESRKKLFMIS